MKANERAFEDAIEASLLEHGGYGSGSPASFDPRSGPRPDPRVRVPARDAGEGAGAACHPLRGRGEDAESGFLKRLAAEIDDRGTLDVLRHGVVDQGVTFKLAFFKPRTG